VDFLQLDSLETATAKLATVIDSMKIYKTEIIPLQNASGRILAGSITSPQNAPNFRRSSVDGYAVTASDTAGAAENSPAFLQLLGRVLIGEETTLSITSGQCIEVPTGGMVPTGANAIVMVEYTENFGDSIAIFSPVVDHENIVNIGDDIMEGATALPSNTLLGAKEIGALAAIGITVIPVYTRPSATIISTGDELVAVGETPPLGKIHDISSHSLKIIAEKFGMEVVKQLVLPDDEAKLIVALKQALQTSDFIFISGGSSYGKFDLTAKIISNVCKPGIFTHGLALKPGKPTILATDEVTNTIIFGLPGHPVSAMVVLELLLKGIQKHPTAPPILATLSTNVPADGKKTIIPCTLNFADGHYIATPIFGKSATITTLTRACGYFIIDEGTEGLSINSRILVHLL